MNLREKSRKWESAITVLDVSTILNEHEPMSEFAHRANAYVIRELVVMIPIAAKTKQINGKLY